jgi:hypothetical protein
MQWINKGNFFIFVEDGQAGAATRINSGCLTGYSLPSEVRNAKGLNPPPATRCRIRAKFTLNETRTLANACQLVRQTPHRRFF